MKKVFLLALLATVAFLSSCDKESKNEDPVNPPTPEKDSFNVQLRYYVSLDMINYLDQKIFATLPGETEKQITLPAPQPIDTLIDEGMRKSIVFMYGMREVLPYDSFKVYEINFVAKKGKCSFRTELKTKSGELPETITCATGYYNFVDGQPKGQSDVSISDEVYTDSTRFNNWVKLFYKDPIVITVP